jgi:predicted lipid carrier protein YhbT
MATAEECQAALESLLARISELDAAEREANLVDRTLSLKVTDLGITFLTRLGPDGAGPVNVVQDGTASAQVRFTTDSNTVVAVAADPGTFARAWLTGKLRVQGNPLDLLRLRKFI